MPELESIRTICRGLLRRHAEKKRTDREVSAAKATAHAINLEMASVVEALRNLPPVEGARYRHALTGIDKMELEQMGIDAWE